MPSSKEMLQQVGYFVVMRVIVGMVLVLGAPADRILLSCSIGIGWPCKSRTWSACVTTSLTRYQPDG